MTYRAPEHAITDPGLIGQFRPGRSATPVVVAALGSVLLITAVVQPLVPRLPYPYYFGFAVADVSPMGGAWKAVIIVVLLALAVLAVFYSRPDIKRPEAFLVIVIGVAALLLNLFVINPAISVLDLMTLRGDWPSYAGLFVLPFFSCIGTFWLSRARDKRLASGILVVTGAYGFLNFLQELDNILTVRLPQDPGPGRASFIGMLGAGAVLIAGLMERSRNRAQGYARDTGDSAPSGRTAVRAAKLATAASAIAIVVAVCYEYVLGSRPSASVSFVLSVAATFTLWVIGPGILALGAFLIVAGRRDPDRRFAGGILITGCLLTLVYFGYSHVFGWIVPLHGYVGWALEGADIGVGAGLAMGLAGVLLLGVRDPAVPAQAMAPETRTAEPDGPRRQTQPEMTRFLCAAAHLDDRYSRQVIGEVVAHPHRATVPSLGIDMGIVLRHCFAARRRQTIRDGLITVLVVSIVPVVLDFHRLAALRDILIFLFLAGAVAFTDRWISRYRVTRELTSERFDPGRGPWLTAAEQFQLAQVRAAEEGNISVYGTYNPFVGSGSPRGGWSMAVNLARGKESPDGRGRLEPEPFEVDELYQEVRQDITALGLPDLSVEDRLLVDGQKIRDDLRFLPVRYGRPVTGIDANSLLRQAREPELQHRPYQCLRLQAWDGDLVLSVFVNFTKRGTALFAEAQHYLLAPLRSDYRQADRLASWSLRQRLRAELRSAPTAVIRTVIAAPFRTIGLLLRMGLGWRAERSVMRRIDAEPEYNFGAVTSIRELAQSNVYRKYFQQVDRDLNTKLIDRQVLDTIMDFLDHRNIDISQFEDQRSTILNNGLLISGGEFKAGSVAVGQQARAGMTQFTQGVASLIRQGGESK